MEFNYTMQTHYNTDFLGTEFVSTTGIEAYNK